MLSDTLRVLRARKGISAAELDGRIGLGSGVIERCEAGEGEPEPQAMQKIARFFGMTREELQLGQFLAYDEERGEILVLQNMGGHRSKVIERVKEVSDI